MIKSWDQYKEFLKADRKALRVHSYMQGFFNERWQFQKLMRRVEYFSNRKDILSKIYSYILKYKLKKMRVALGFSIDINTCGKGLELGHYGDIVINGKAKLGNNITIAGAGVLIGEDLYTGSAPVISDNVYIGPGVKIIGNVFVAEGITIAANSVVTKSIFDKYTTYGGIPAVLISKRSVKGTERSNNF